MPKANTAAVLASNRLHLALIGASVSAGGSCYYGRVAAASAESPQNSLPPPILVKSPHFAGLLSLDLPDAVISAPFTTSAVP